MNFAWVPLVSSPPSPPTPYPSSKFPETPSTCYPPLYICGPVHPASVYLWARMTLPCVSVGPANQNNAIPYFHVLLSDGVFCCPETGREVWRGGMCFF